MIRRAVIDLVARRQKGRGSRRNPMLARLEAAREWKTEGRDATNELGRSAVSFLKSASAARTNAYVVGGM